MASMPCLPFQIPDVILFRTKIDPIALERQGILSVPDEMAKAIKAPVDSDKRTIELTQGYGTTLKLTAQRFHPPPLVETEESLKFPRCYFSHPFYLPDMDDSRARIRQFIKASVQSYMHAKIPRTDTLSRSVFRFALELARSQSAEYQRNRDFIRRVLCLWTAARTIEGGWTFSGAEMLNLEPNCEGKVPLVSAKFIDFQMWKILSQDILMPLREAILKQMKELILRERAENWFSLFLANFMLLHSYGLLMKQQVRFSRMQHANVRGFLPVRLPLKYGPCT